MKLYLQILVLSFVFVQAAPAEIKDEIALFDKRMIQACQLAETNAASSRRNKTESFLRDLSNLERQYKNAGDRDGLLACLKTRAKYDPKAQKINQPTQSPEQLRVLVFALEKQLSDIDRYKSKTIIEAKHGRARKLTALMRGLVKRGEREDAELVIAALKSTPDVPKIDPKETEGETIIPKEVTYLTYNRPTRKWIKMDGKGVKKKVSRDTTTLHYADGEHWLLKVLWSDVLKKGDRLSVEVEGVFSVELVDLDGVDANARFNVPKSDGFTTVEIAREKDEIIFIYDGKPQKTYYASGKLRGNDARDALVATSLRAAFSVKKGEQASFRNAKLVRP